MRKEIWKPIPGYEDTYAVSSLGRVRRIVSGNAGQYAAGRWVRATPQPNGYLAIGLCKGKNQKRHLLHALVLTAFRGKRPKGMQCRHLDGNRSNNVLSNLKWGTRQQNAQDSKRHGTFAIGERNGFSTLKRREISAIRCLSGLGITCKTLGELFNTHVSNICLILARKTWRHVKP